jgi:hypothetical protein
MPGYPCCCKPGKPQCGACQGTAPQQYQLTVPEDLFVDTDPAQGSCGERCAEYSAIYLLDYDPNTEPIGFFEGVTCVWVSEIFEICYIFIPANPDLGIFEDIVETNNWRWHLYTSDTSEPDKVNVHLVLFGEVSTAGYVWYGLFDSNNCGQPLELEFLQYISDPMVGCALDEDKKISLEPAP